MDLLKDDTRKLFYKFLIPAISSAIAVAAYSFVDTIVIGQGVGSVGMAACAVVLPIFSIAHFLSLLCGIGGSVLMSKARGSGNTKKGDAYFTASILFSCIVTAVIWILGMTFQEPFYRLCGADDKLLPYAMEYGSLIFGFFPTFVFVPILGYFIRTDGSPKVAMYVTLIGGVINMIGDWLFVFPLNMGMMGAALATVLGSAVQTILLLVYILSGKTKLKLAKPFKWLRAIKKIGAIGFGAGISQIAVIAVTFIVNNQVMKYSGSSALAVYGMLSTIAALYLCIFEGIGQAAQPVVSANFGAKEHNRYLSVGRLGLKTATVSGLICAAICIVFPSQVTRMFMKVTPEVAEIAPYILRVYSISFLPLAVNMFVMAYLQSVGKANAATVISLLRGITLNVALLYILPLFMKGDGIWWAITIAESVAAVVAVIYTVFFYNSINFENQLG